MLCVRQNIMNPELKFTHEGQQGVNRGLEEKETDALKSVVISRDNCRYSNKDYAD